MAKGMSYFIKTGTILKFSKGKVERVFLYHVILMPNGIVVESYCDTPVVQLGPNHLAPKRPLRAKLFRESFLALTVPPLYSNCSMEHGNP